MTAAETAEETPGHPPGSEAGHAPGRRTGHRTGPQRRRRLRVPAFALAVPAWLFILFFFLAPVGLVLWYSFGYKPGLFGFHANDVLSLDRYGEVLQGPFWATFKNTLKIALIGTGLSLVIALPFAYWLAVVVPPKWRGPLLALVLVPFWANFLVRTIGWRIILAPSGVVSWAAETSGLADGPLSMLDTRGAVQLGVIYNYLPLMILPIYVALERMQPALREASKDLGAGRWATLRQVTLPLAMPGIVAGLLLVFIPLMGDYITASVLGGAKGNMVGQLVASEFQQAQNWARGSAAAVVLILVILTVVAVAALLGLAGRQLVRIRRRVDIGEPSGGERTRGLGAARAGDLRGPSGATSRGGPSAATGGRRPTARARRRRRDWRGIVLSAWSVLVFAFLFLPILFVLAYSFNAGRLLVAWDGFGFDAYEALLTKPPLRDAVWTSLKAAAGAAVVSTILGSLAGVALARRPGKWSVLFVGLLALVLVTPEIVDAVALLPWLVSLGTEQNIGLFNNGIVRLVVGHSMFSTAVVTFIVRARMTGIDETLEEAAADLYASPWRRFRQITLPLMMPAVLAGGLLAFTLSLDNTIVSSFISVQGSTPWPVYVFSALRSGLRPDIAAMSAVMLALTFAALALVALVLRRAGDSSTDIARTMTG